MNSLGNYLDNTVNYRVCSGIKADQHIVGLLVFHIQN